MYCNTAGFIVQVHVPVYFILLYQEAFVAFHNDLKEVRKYLRPIYVGQLETTPDARRDSIKRDFAELRDTVEKRVILSL